ncbi:MAG: DUF4199 domain-containing protein [Chitinophagaceae bacterium]|nr:DUF4199 domain-containing protein [Chitinophagaceae bacterium]
MKPVVFRYGIYATLAIVALSAFHFFVIVPSVSWANAEIAGYLTMILSMIFVFLGIRYYRDHVNNGTLGFGQGLKIGLLIVLIPSVFFGLFDILYTEVLNPSFFEDYYTHQIEVIRASYTKEQAAAKIKSLDDQKEMFGNPVFQFLLMAATVFVIGFIVTIISSLTLMKKKNASIA